MNENNDKSLSAVMLKARNKILIEFGDYSFDQALDEIKNSLATEKDRAKRLTLLSAKSWIIRNKVYAMMHEPFVYSLNELENTNIFSDLKTKIQVVLTDFLMTMTMTMTMAMAMAMAMAIFR